MIDTSFIENEDFWDKCQDTLCTSIANQLVYYFIKDSIKDQQFFIKSKYEKFSNNTRVVIVKIRLPEKLQSLIFLVKRDEDCGIIVDKLIPSYRKRLHLFIENNKNIYQKNKSKTLDSFLNKYNVVNIFREN